MAKQVWITGAERSLGLTMRDHFSDRGWDTQSLSRPMWDLEMDLQKLASMFEEHLYTHGIPDVFVHNAGIMYMDWIENQDILQFERVMRVNLTSRYVLNKVLLTMLKQYPQKQCRIIHITSMGYRLALRQSPAYCASKAGDAHLVKQLAKEISGRIPNAYICAVAPGAIQKTAMVEQAVEGLMQKRGMSEEDARKYNVQSPMGRNCTMEEVSAMVYFAATQAPTYTQGHTFELCGGM